MYNNLDALIVLVTSSMHVAHHPLLLLGLYLWPRTSMHLPPHLSVSGGNLYWSPYSPYDVDLLKRTSHALVTPGGPWGPEDPPAEVDDISEG